MFLVLKTEPFPVREIPFCACSKNRSRLNFHVLPCAAARISIPPCCMPINTAKRIFPCCCARRLHTAHRPQRTLPTLPAPFAVFQPRFFPAYLFLQTALQHLRKQTEGTPLPLLGISDRNGLLANCIPPFADVAAHIRIFTAAPQRYAAVCEQVFCERGLPLILSDSEAALRSCTVQLLPFAENAAPYFPGQLVTTATGVVYAGTGLELPAELAARRPPDTNVLQFVSALYELCNVPLPKTLCYDALHPIKSGKIY